MFLRRFCLSAFALLCLLGLSAAQLPCQPQQTNALPGQLRQLGLHRSIDDTCGCEGAGKGSVNSPIRQANDAQNKVKNNFQLAPNVQQKLITVGDMIRLQGAVDDIPQELLQRGDRFHLPSPAQRARLHGINIGPNKQFSEGDLVTLVGFVIGARHSNTDDGESVNCNLAGCAANDIHVDVTAHPRDPDVDKGEQMNEEGVSAEISPHHRPAAWETFDASAYRSVFRQNPVMFAGQLFYDASHSPGGGPDRAAVWEVHPVYAIWVCRNTTLSQCPATKQNDPTVWIPFDQVQGLLHLNVQTTAKCQDNP
jgi:hypothetical protein